MKKLLAMVLALVMTLSLAVSASAFKDDDKVSASYEEAVAVLNGMGVFKGYEDGTFKPEGDITRAEVAAIVYRVYTQDVKDAKASMYATYNKFSDMAGAGWAQGYIGYCANAELVKGYPNGTFQPSGKVTGYEVLAMILRAIGYDKNGEFSGADWALHVAQTAQQAGVLKNVKGVDLNAPASRELVAELLFRAIADANMVTYTAAFGYQTVSFNGKDDNGKLFKDNETLGHKNFELTPKDDNDEWGRPATTWEYNVGDEETTIVDTPDASFNVATTECDICEALSVKKSAKIVEIYTNGVKKGTDTLTATETKDTLGKQGQQIEFYKNDDGDYRMVVIDTYLAKVNSAKAEKVDSKNHVESDAYLTLAVYNKDHAANGEKLYVKSADYAEDDYLLVNVNEDSANNVKITGFTDKQPLVQIVGKADSFDGAQTKIYKSADKHTIADKDYDDAYQFNHDEAADYTSKFTWFLDQFGNLIGSVALDRSSYAVLKDIVWEVGKPGYAEATLISMVDGKESKATVDKITEFDTTDEFGDVVTPKHSSTKQDVFGWIGEDTSDNDSYLGLAMYKVETNDDETVKLLAGNIEYKEGTSVAVKTSAIMKNGTEVASLSKNTQFLIRTNDGTTADPDYKYTMYTGTAELPAMKAGSVKLFWVDSNDDNFADYVYITDYVSDTLGDSYVFATSDDSYRIPDDLTSSSDYIWTMNVYVNGEKKEITLTTALRDLLADNVGKLFVAKFNTTTGDVSALLPVNEDTDGTSAHATTVKGLVADYVTGKLEIAAAGLRNTEGGVTTTYNTTDVTVISTNSKFDTLDELEHADEDDFAKLGIWIVADSDADSAHKQSVTIYVGEKLSSSVAPIVSIKPTASLTSDAQGKVDVDKDGKITVTFNSGVTSATLVYTGEGELSLVKGARDTDYKMNSTEDAVEAAKHTTRTVAVMSEDGTKSANVTVYLEWATSLEYSDVVVTMDPAHGATITFKAVAEGFTIDTTNGMTARIYNSNGTAVATTGNISVAQSGNTYTITVPCTLTQGDEYYAVVTVGDFYFTTDSVEAQTVTAP